MKLYGRIIEIGNVECLQSDGCEPRAGILIETTEAALRGFPGNLIFADVEIEVSERPPDAPVMQCGDN